MHNILGKNKFCTFLDLWYMSCISEKLQRSGVRQFDTSHLEEQKEAMVESLLKNQFPGEYDHLFDN